MSGSLIDANVLLDVATNDPVWFAWSQAELYAAAKRGPLRVNPIIYAEIAPAFGSPDALDRWLDPVLFERVPLPFEAAWRAAQAFVTYRRSGGVKNSPLPDFYIGAHAEIAGLTRVTRDAGRYRTYFPGLTVISPSI